MSATKPPTEAGTTGPSTASVVLVLGLAAILGAIIIALVYLMPEGDGERVLTWVTGMVTLATGGAATGAAVLARRAASGVETVRRQTNGVLDARIRQQVGEALQDVGLTPARRAGDPVPETPDSEAR